MAAEPAHSSAPTHSRIVTHQDPREGIGADERKLLSALDASRALRDLKRLTEDVIKTPSGVGDASVVSGSIEETAMAEDIAASSGPWVSMCTPKSIPCARTAMIR